ncbi:uncharacterized protein [Apostichopus japonicus]|uniref:uncharacterized protein n=1 Tax=Stichopus japonicus TaxID=307972 RepID=UPI003AB434C4
MIPRPSIRVEGVNDDRQHDFDEGLVERNGRPIDTLPPADYPRDKYSPVQDGLHRAVQPSTVFREFYPSYPPNVYSPYPAYATYRPSVPPIRGPAYDPYNYWPSGYGQSGYGLNQQVYYIPPGTSFELISQEPHQAKPTALERFEVESITGRGEPHHVRNVSTGERFVVEPSIPQHLPVTYEQDPLYRYPGPVADRFLPGPRRVTQVVPRSDPVFRHAIRRVPAGSTSSYTDGSTHTRSGPHFMNGVDYLDVSTRSRILNWLDSSQNRPIRLRQVTGPGRPNRPISREPVRYRVHRSLGPQ